MATRERMRRELKELAQRGATLRQERSAYEDSSGKWSYIAPKGEGSAPAAVQEGPSSARPSSVSVPPPASWSAARLSPDGLGVEPHPPRHRGVEPSARKWLFGLGAAAFLIGASLFGRTFADSHPPAAPAIVIATQPAPLPPPPDPSDRAPSMGHGNDLRPDEKRDRTPETTRDENPLRPPPADLPAQPSETTSAPPPLAPRADGRPASTVGASSATTAPTSRPPAGNGSGRRPPAANRPAPLAAPAVSHSLDELMRKAVNGNPGK